MAEFVHQTYNDSQAHCTWDVVDSDFRGVHYAYMGKKPKFTVTPIRKWRKAANVTQEQAAEAIARVTGEFTHASVSRIEGGKQPYSQEALEAMARLYRTTPGALIDRDPNAMDELELLVMRVPAKDRPTVKKFLKSLIEQDED